MKKKHMPKGEIAMEDYEESKKNIFESILKEATDESEESVAWDKGYELYKPGRDPAEYNPYSSTGRLSMYFMEGWNTAKSDNE